MLGVNDDCYVHYYIQQQNFNRLGDILVYTCSGVETMVDCLQLTQSGSMLKWQCSLAVVGGAWAKLRPFAKNLWTAWSETVLIICGD